ncbi:MAG: hypothetical protein ABI652_03055, partial [Acidobacteriota bacterium]
MPSRWLLTLSGLDAPAGWGILMSFSRARDRYLGLLPVVIGVITSILCVPLAADAQHRARIGRRLDSQIATSTGPLTVVVQAPQSEVDRLVRTYGVQIAKRLDMGAVLSGTSAQLNGVASDANVAALAADAVVESTMAVATQSTGASQLWKAKGTLGNFGGLTGLGIGVAVIDSGIGSHPDV